MTSILLDQGLTSLVSFLTTIVLSRIWSVDNYANFVLLISVTMIILGFQRALISQPYIINLNDFSGQESHSYFYSNIWYKLIFTAVVIVMLPAILFYKPESFEDDNLILFTCFVTSYISFYFVKDVLLGKRETARNLVYSLFSNLLLVFVLAWIFLAQNQDSFIYFGLASIIYLACFLFFCFKNKSFLNLKPGRLVTYFKPNWCVGKWIAGSNLFYTISSQIYPWLLLWFVSKNEVAIYGVLISISSLVNPFITSIKTYLLPIFTRFREDKHELMVLVRKWIVSFSLFTIALILFGFLLGEQVIGLIFGSKYASLGLIVVLPFIDQGLNVLFQPIDLAMNAVKRTDIGFWLLIFRSVIAILLGFYLVQNYGIVGVFATRIAENVIYQIANVYVYKRVLGT